MLEVYTDGSCLKNPSGPIGWAAVFIDKGTIVNTVAGGWSQGTNNQAELMAAIQAVLNLPEGVPATVYSDSEYVVKGISMWVEGWRKKNFKDIKNVEFWKYLDWLVQRRQVTFKWVRGHAGNHFNEVADKIAGAQALEHVGKPKAGYLGATLPGVATIPKAASGTKEPVGTTVDLEIDKDLLEHVRAVARAKGVTLNRWICQSLKASVDEHEYLARGKAKPST